MPSVWTKGTEEPGSCTGGFFGVRRFRQLGGQVAVYFNGEKKKSCDKLELGSGVEKKMWMEQTEFVSSAQTIAF